MITYTQLVDVVNNINDHRKGFVLGPYEKHLTISLQLYKARQEFDGTVESAILCLMGAGYEFDKHCMNILKIQNSFD